MKSSSSLWSTAVFSVVLSSLFTISSCKKETRSEAQTSAVAVNTASKAMMKDNSGAPLKLDIIHSYTMVQDAAYQRITPAMPGSTLIFDSRGHTPVLAPDGHQMTLEEYNQPSGWAEIKCVEKGTHVVFHLKDLMPGGIYTVWVIPFKAPGFDGTFTNMIGSGALGAPDGSENQFKVSAAGTASLSVIMPAGALSVFGSVPACLGDVYETHFGIAYHSDFMAHGSSPGTPDTWVIPFAFAVYGSQL